MENTQSHGTPVIEFYTWSWSKTNGHTSSRIYVTMIGGFILGGQLAEEGFAGSVPLNILTRIEVTNAKMQELKAKMEELRAIAKRGY